MKFRYLIPALALLFAASLWISVRAQNGGFNQNGSSGSGSGTVSGQAAGVIPLGTSSTAISNQSHLDDGNTTAATITSSEPIAAPSYAANGTHAGYFQCGPGSSDSAPPSLVSANFQLVCPASITNYQMLVPAASATGFLFGTNTANSNQLSFLSAVPWSSLGNPTGNLALSMGTDTSIFSGTAATSQFFAWKNTTAAVVGTSQGSPVNALCGRAFHGSADVEDCMTFSELPGNGNDAAIAFTIAHTGTSTGAVTLTVPNTLVPAGTESTCVTGLQVGGAGVGFGDYLGAAMFTCANGASVPQSIDKYGVHRFQANAVLGWNNSTDATAAAADTAISRISAKPSYIEFGDSESSPDTNAKLEAAAFISAGTKFTTNGGCGETTGLAGGASAGTITTAGSTGCTTIVTMGNTATAPNGWSCTAIDLTTAGDVTNPHQTATTATTATFASGTIVAADVIQFSCQGY